MAKNEVRERLLMDGPKSLSNAALLTLCGAEIVSGVSVRRLAWVSVGSLNQSRGPWSAGVVRKLLAPE